MLGVALTALGACGFAVKGIFAKLLYARGWNYLEVIALRSLLALPVLWAWAAWRLGTRHILHAPRGALLGAAASGLFCYYLGTLLDFRALAMVDASIERVLLFAYPSMVVVLHAVLYRRWPTWRAWASLGGTYLGIFMVVSGFDVSILRANVAGAGLVLICAFTFAVYYLASDRWATGMGSVRFTLVAVTASAGALATHLLLLRPWPAASRFTAADVALFGGLVVISTVLPMVLTAEGVRRLGAPRAAIVSTVGPPVTIALGALLLGEVLSITQWLGVALIASGLIVLETKRR